MLRQRSRLVDAVSKTAGEKIKDYMKKFWSGFITYSAILSLHQDMIGKEKLLKVYELTWIDPLITVPLAIITIIIATFLYNAD